MLENQKSNLIRQRIFDQRFQNMFWLKKGYVIRYLEKNLMRERIYCWRFQIKLDLEAVNGIRDFKT